jgi:dTDP-glucose 4,6-dehydratase
MILVTGGAGFIGSNFVLDWLAQSDEPVVNLDALTYAGNTENLASLAGDSRHVFVRGDICDRELVDRLFAEHRPRAVVHFAAESHVDRSIHGPAEFIRTNVQGTFTLLEAARKHWSALTAADRTAFRFLHVSTDEVYGSLARDEPAFRESDTYEPNSPYSASKAASDHLVRAWHHTYGLPVLTTNCSNNYGPFHFPEKLIPLLIVNALAGKPLAGLRRRPAGARLALRQGPLRRDPRGAGARSRRRDLQRRRLEREAEPRDRPCGVPAARRAEGASRRPVRAPRHARHRSPGHDRRYAIDASKIERELGWRPAETFESGLRKTVRWYLDNAAWVERVQNGAYREWVSTQLRLVDAVKILLLGKNGQVGWELQRSLAVLGDVVAVDVDSAPPWRLDFMDQDALRALVAAAAPDLIVNAAAHTAVDKAEAEPELVRVINATAVGTLAREAAARGAWLVHYSTDYVFDGSGSAPWTEQSVPAPLSVYGRTKAEGEELIRQSRCRHLIFRTSWVYAARGENFAKTILRLARSRDSLSVIDDQIGAPTGAELLADVTAIAARAVRDRAELSGRITPSPAGRRAGTAMRSTSLQSRATAARRCGSRPRRSSRSRPRRTLRPRRGRGIPGSTRRSCATRSA